MQIPKTLYHPFRRSAEKKILNFLEVLIISYSFKTVWRSTNYSQLFDRFIFSFSENSFEFLFFLKSSAKISHRNLAKRRRFSSHIHHYLSFKINGFRCGIVLESILILGNYFPWCMNLGYSLKGVISPPLPRTKNLERSWKI